MLARVVGLILLLCLPSACGESASQSAGGRGKTPSLEEPMDDSEPEVDDGEKTSELGVDEEGKEASKQEDFGEIPDIPDVPILNDGIVLGGEGPANQSSKPALILVMVHRSVKKAHLYSVNPSEGAAAGFQYEGPAFQLLASEYPGAVPLYRCVEGKHFLSVDPGCGGATTEGPLGYILTSQQPMTAALHPCNHPDGKDFIAVTNLAECQNAGYAIGAPLGYVPLSGFGSQ